MESLIAKLNKKIAQDKLDKHGVLYNIDWKPSKYYKMHFADLEKNDTFKEIEINDILYDRLHPDLRGDDNPTARIIQSVPNLYRPELNNVVINQSECCIENVLPEILRYNVDIIYGECFQRLRNEYLDNIRFHYKLGKIKNNQHAEKYIKRYETNMERAKDVVDYKVTLRQTGGKEYENFKKKKNDMVKKFKQSEKYNEYMENRSKYINNAIKSLYYSHNSHNSEIHKTIKNINIDILIKILHARCFFCKHFDHNYCGIDRIIHNKYILSWKDIVPSCYMCNMMKSDLNIVEFNLLCDNIYNNLWGDKNLINYKYTHTASIIPYTSYKNNATVGRNLKFELDKQSYDDLLKQECYNCGVQNASGIDRQNNDIGYTVENCVPCCTSCNYLKYIFDSNNFYKKIYKLYKQPKFVTEKNEVCTVCDNKSMWKCVNNNENLCHWCMINILIFGITNFVSHSIAICNADPTDNRNADCECIIDYPKSYQELDYLNNAKGIHSMYYTHGNYKDAKYNNLINTLIKTKTCDICKNDCEGHVLPVSENDCEYADNQKIKYCCINCVLYKNGCTLDDMYQRANFINKKYSAGIPDNLLIFNFPNKIASENPKEKDSLFKIDRRIKH